MSIEWLAVLVVVGLLAAAIGAVTLRRRGVQRSDDQRGLPPELVGAQVAYAERTFRSRQRKLVARLDRAYRVSGELTLVELKTRGRDVVYLADAIELSVQRLVLQDSTGERVSETAWALVEQTGSGIRRAHAVRLMSGEAIGRLSRRYRQLARGTVKDALPAASMAQCEKCGHFERCQATFKDRD